MWPFQKKQPKKGGRLMPLCTPCSLSCTCSFPEVFKYRELPELVGTKLTLASMNSIPEDVRRQLNVQFKIGQYIEWARDSPLPGYAGELWKFRRAELAFDIDEVVTCDIANKAVIQQLALHLDGDFP